MDKERIEELANDPRFIPGIYNYCDRWCERCPFTSRCMNCALSEGEFDGPETRDICNQAFWDKLGEVFQATIEMVREKALELGIDLDAIDLDEVAREDKLVHDAAREQPYSQAAMKYIRAVDEWFNANREALEDRCDELQSLAQADIPGTSPAHDAATIRDCLEVIRWYQRQVYVKLCRAASGALRGELENIEYAAEDADGSAKVAIIGIERSIAAWGELLNHLPEEEDRILSFLVGLKGLLRKVEAAFPDARAFLRPGFDTPESPLP
jgi:hypothetical protein